MKKWIIPAVALMLFSGVQAAEKKPKGKGPDANGDGQVTKAEFLAAGEKRAEATGNEFDAKKAEAIFAKKDANKDGVLTGDELSRGPKGNKGPDGKKKAAEDDEE